MTTGTCLGISLTPCDVRCVVVDGRGETLARSTAPLGTAEARDPEAWWSALKIALGMLSDAGTGTDLSAIEVIGLAGTPHGAVFLDDAGNALAPAIIEGDQDGQSWCAWLEATARRSRAINGSLAKPDMLGVGLLHLREESPDAFRQLNVVLAPKDYLVFRLTGEKATDPATASASLLYDTVEKTWAPRILKPLGLQADKLPEVIAPGALVGSVLESVTTETGLGPVPVVAGTSDLVALSLDLGITRHGEGLLFLGQRTNLTRLNTAFMPDPYRHIDMRAFATDDLYFHLANIGPAAEFDVWARALDGGAGDDTPGRDLYFLPQLGHGATMAGLSPQSTPQDMARAVLHGAAFEIAETLATLNDLLATEETLHFLAPPALGRAWGPFLASATDTPLAFHEDDGFGIARGGAGLANQYRSDTPYDQARARPEPVECFLPQPELKARFEQIKPKLAGLKSRLTHSG